MHEDQRYLCIGDKVSKLCLSSIQDICISAVKEKDIEAKLKTTIAEWNGVEFAFGNFKARGELLLRGDTTTEIIGQMEDSLMILSSLLSNRLALTISCLIGRWAIRFNRCPKTVGTQHNRIER